MDIHALIAILRDEKVLEQFGVILEKKVQKPY
jgi:UDP-N-acetylenolpyruvoylglucosamine reductase